MHWAGTILVRSVRCASNNMYGGTGNTHAWGVGNDHRKLKNVTHARTHTCPVLSCPVEPLPRRSLGPRREIGERESTTSDAVPDPENVENALNKHTHTLSLSFRGID